MSDEIIVNRVCNCNYEKLKEKINHLEKEIYEYKTNTKKILADLQCCGNCLNENCPNSTTDIPDGWSGYCDKWEFDGLTREERIIEKQ